MTYNKYGPYLKETFGSAVYKITVDAGFTCPNRDGSKGVGGCTYCNNEKFFQDNGKDILSVKEQVLKKISYRKRKKLEKYIVYFQTYSNTYGSTDYLKSLYESVLDIKNVIGIAIGTRVDCIDDEKLKLLKEISNSHYVCLEYGLESISNETLSRINRGHDIDCFVETVKKTHEYGIDICAHLMFGFPWESQKIAKESALFLNQLPIKFVKIHQLQIVKNSIMGNDYKKSAFQLLGKNDYLNYLLDFLTALNPKTVVQRVAGDCPAEILIAAGFSESSINIAFELDQKMKELELLQGISFKEAQ